jgi:protein-disulfide isomerase
LALAAFVFWCAPIRWRSKAAESAGSLALTSRDGATSILIGLVGVGVLIGGQFAVSPPAANIQIIEASKFKPSNSSASSGAPKPPAVATPSPSPLTLGVPPHHPIIVVGGRATIDAGEVPLLGDPDADTVVVEVFDYTCPECRSLHRHMQEARDRYGKQLAWALLPTPINAHCNKYVPVTKPPHERACEYARLALAVWIARPAAFGEYHNWLMQPVEPPPLVDARQRASELIAPKPLDAALADARIDRQLAADVGIYHVAGDGAVPKLLIDGSVLVGSPATTDKLCEVLEKYGRLTK